MTRNNHTLIISILVSLISINVQSQTKESIPKSKIHFCSKNEFGVLVAVGSIKDHSDIPVHTSDLLLELSTTNGIQYDRFFVGAGCRLRKWSKDFLVPLFLSSSIDLWKKKNSLFIHLELGHLFGTRDINYFDDREIGSFFTTYGLGFDLSVSKHTKLYLKANICHQKMKASAKSGLGPSTYLEPYNPTYLFAGLSLGLKFIK